ncbi:hypothetical protein HDU82_006338 [Entophlyctis luteolus]|nr:hypothetical protein HDU82_006338 [Entophlyctis luteolus]
MCAKGRGKRPAKAQLAAAKKPAGGHSIAESDELDMDKREKRILRLNSQRPGRMDEMVDYNAHEVDVVDPDDDEDLDEDCAFNDSDEERFGVHFAHVGSAATGKSMQPKKESAADSDDDDLLDEGYSEDTKGKRKRATDDEDEIENDGDDDWGSDAGDLMDISDMLGTAPSKAVPINPSYQSVRQAADDVDNILLAKHSESLDSDIENDSLYDTDADESNEADLSKFVDNLDKSSRKRKTIKETTEAYTENEFNLRARRAAVISDSTEESTENAPASSGDAKLDLSDLVGGVSTESTFTNLRKQLSVFTPTAGPHLPAKAGSLRAPGTEAAPLPIRVQDRIGRQAAYEAASKEVSRWTNVVAKNRSADQLDFSSFDKQPSSLNSSGALVGQFEPVTGLESEIAKLLEESALSEKKQMELDDLALNKISKEELAERRRELAKLRSLAFYAEQKAKRIAKIKSKTYRKIHKKADARKAAKEGGNELSIEELRDIDPDAARDKVEKAHMDRIKERMSLKHKGTGKWARKMLSKKDSDPETRQALMDQLNVNQNLTRKIAGLESDEDSDDLNSGEGSDRSDSDDENETTNRAVERARKKLEAIEHEIDEDSGSMPAKGIFGMKFMQKGLANQIKESKALLDQARQSLVGSDNEEETAVDWPQEKKLGRKTFQPGADQDGSESDSSMHSGDDTRQMKNQQFNLKSTKPISIHLDGSQTSTYEHNAATFHGKISDARLQDPEVSSVERKPKPAAVMPKKKTEVTRTKESIPPTSALSHSENDEANPWLTSTPATGKKSLKRTKETNVDKAVNKLNKQIKQQSSHEDSASKLLLNLDGVQKLEVAKKTTSDIVKPEVKEAISAAKAGKNSSPGSKNANRTKVQSSARKIIVNSMDSEEDSDEEQLEKAAKSIVYAANVTDLSQRELMQLAFANDDVVDEFQEEKSGIVAADAPKLVDETLPGWGSWAGSDLAPKTGLITKVVKSRDSVDASKRKDTKLQHVIINERRMKRANKYLTSQLPFGYESREQYEQALRMPLGTEWNTAAAHAKLTAPKVVTRMGTVIHPLKMKGFGPPLKRKKK